MANTRPYSTDTAKMPPRAVPSPSTLLHTVSPVSAFRANTLLAVVPTYTHPSAMVAVDWKFPVPPPAVDEKAQLGWRSPGASAPRSAGWLRVLERSCPKEGQSPPLLPEAHPVFPCAPAPTRAVATSAPITTNAV